MTPEQQRIAIAKACGWAHQPTQHNPHYWQNDQYMKNIPWVIYSARNELCLPDYLSDLNAMHEAEKTLTDEQYRGFLVAPSIGYLDHLMELTATTRTGIAHATAAQRAEAFLRTLNLWTS